MPYDPRALSTYDHTALYDPPPYTPYASRAPRTPQNATQNQTESTENLPPPRTPRIAVAQAELDDTVAVMRANLAALAARGERIEDIESRTGTSHLSPPHFNPLTQAQKALLCPHADSVAPPIACTR